VAGQPRSGRSPKERAAIAHVDSPPLTKIVGEMLRESDNQTAEMLTKELGLRKGAGPTTAAGVAVITADLARLGLPVAGAVRDDGSGLDDDDKATCQLLTAALDHAGPRSPLADGLPVAATSGTLQDRFENTPGAGRVRAKTGSLTSVSSLSGFVATEPGAHATFSFLSNGAQVSDALLRLEERIANQLVSYPAGVDLTAAGPR
jgi:D-alanyl-D-alanine carboxypeptidase/D-alanyl-D-alanine-endopeptidase (penicillin-binding protein 4)